MWYIIVFVVAFALGYLACSFGAVITMRNGDMFYRDREGIWHPYDPKS